jgi:hypothetical protein
MVSPDIGLGASITQGKEAGMKRAANMTETPKNQGVCDRSRPRRLVDSCQPANCLGEAGLT